VNAREKQPDQAVLRQHLTRWVVWLCVLVAAVFVMSVYFKAYASAPEADAARTVAPGGELKIEHDEVIMLMISLVVLIEIVVSFNLIRLIPHRGILLCGFVLFVLAAVCTVAEGFVFNRALNYTEHLSLTGSAILLAVWCSRMFRSPRQEDA
jgi:magnesium-transporting ATPase (P-type)